MAAFELRKVLLAEGFYGLSRRSGRVEGRLRECHRY